MYRGLRNGVEVIGWNTNVERVYSKIRKMIPKDRSRGNEHKFSIESRVFIEKQG